MFEQLLARMATAFESRRVPYMVIGGQAVLVYGEPRFSKDIDVTLGWDSPRLPELLEIIQGLGWKVLVDKPQEFVDSTMVLPCEDSASGIRFDFIFSFSGYERQALDRAVARSVAGANVRYAAVEDMVILKIVAGRPRDLEDAKGIVLKNSNHDRAYVKKWLSSFESALDRSLLKTYESFLP